MRKSSLSPEDRAEQRIRNIHNTLKLSIGLMCGLAGAAIIGGLVRACRQSVAQSTSDVAACDGDLHCMDLEHDRDVLPDPDEKH